MVCSVSVSNCLREWSVDNSMKSEGDFTPDSFWTKSKAASALSNEGVDVDIERLLTFRDGLLSSYHGYSTYAEAREAATAAP